jgi:hypothetical protein
MSAQFPHPNPCECRGCCDYAERLTLVEALDNPVPVAVADALFRQWCRYDDVGFLPLSSAPNLVPHELEQASQQKPLARGV